MVPVLKHTHARKVITVSKVIWVTYGEEEG